ncbi:aromatic-L-amino-acid decarboxylase-like [Diadema setosum]|uniref:aromatic-L-amino-acid decarboxylase-like n=1 Tax=Diadema setosum TaxID=31175 RepID=UPI003B3B73C5
MTTDSYKLNGGKEMVDYIADYLTTIRSRRTLPDVQPGYLRNLIPESAPIEGDRWSDIMSDIERVIMPGITHWQSPHMHAYFPALTSYPSMLGDMLADAIGNLGFTWASSPACTELEKVVMDWLADLIGLPSIFTHRDTSGPGGGVIQGTMSEATLVSMFAARREAITRLQTRQEYQDMEEAVICSKLVAYCTDQAHSSLEKNAVLAMVKLRHVPSDQKLSLRGEALRAAISQDREHGLIPFYVCATLGTTGACAFDNLEELGAVCEEENLWLHVDAAYAGTAFVCPEFRGYLRGVEKVQSFAFNPSKWLMVHFDCTAMWIRDGKTLERAFCVRPLYLRHDKQGTAIDLMHWQIPLSRRFRSLKLWFVLRSFGVKKLQEHVRRGVRRARYFEELVSNDAAFEIPAERILGLVVFRLKGPNAFSEELLRRLNLSGKIYMVPASIKGLYVIRFTVTSTETTEDDIFKDWRLIQGTAREIFVTTDIVANVPTRMASWPGALNLTGGPKQPRPQKLRWENNNEPIENDEERKAPSAGENGEEEEEENEERARKDVGPVLIKPGRERKGCLTKLLNYRKKLGRRAMSEEAEGYGYPFNAYYSFEDTSSGLPSPCEDDPGFEIDDEVFGSNNHIQNGYHKEENHDEEAKLPTGPGTDDTGDNATKDNEREETNPEVQNTDQDLDHKLQPNDMENTNALHTKLECVTANGQTQPVSMGTEKPVNVGVASKGRFGALSQTKESTYNGVVNICHYRSTKGSVVSQGDGE